MDAQGLRAGDPPLLPTHMPPRPPHWSRKMSARLRERHRRALGIWRSACKVSAALNSVNDGKGGTTITRRALEEQPPLGACPMLAKQSMHARVLAESARLERWRGSFDCIGVLAVAILLKVTAAEAYGFRTGPRSSRAPMVAADTDEPVSHQVVPMLEVLPEEEAS